MPTPRVMAVIPAYNEAATIGDVVDATRPHVEEVLVVDDGSSDDTPSVLAQRDVRILRNARNLGKAQTLWRGLREARRLGATDVVTLDADGQHPPELIPRLRQAAAQCPGHLIVGARQGKRESAPALRRWANAFADFWISWAAGRPLVDTQSGFRLYPGELVDRMPDGLARSRAFVFESQVLIEASHAGYEVAYIAMPSLYPQGLRPSHYRPLADGLLIVAMVARHLLVRWMYPQGLYHALRDPRPRVR